MKKTMMSSFTCGMITGAMLGLAFAPEKGTETRKKVMKKLNPKSIKKYVETEMKMIKEELEKLNFETLIKPAKKRIKDIENSIENLFEYVQKEGTPMLIDSVNELKDSSIEMIDKTLNRLENKQ